jgi:hypothetical protein
MKCFNHTNVDAIAICKNCNKGLCQECAADTGVGVACKDKCESDVALLNVVFRQSTKAYQNASKTYLQFSIWMAVIGFGMLIFSLFLPNPIFLIFMGSLFIIAGIVYYFTSKRYK